MPDLSSFLFFDLVTARSTPEYNNLPTVVQQLLVGKINTQEHKLFQDAYAEQAVFYPELARIIAINIGMLVSNEQGGYTPTIHTISDKHFIESAIINGFFTMVERIKEKRSNSGKGDLHLAGFNIKRFDVPFLSKRSLINEIAIPQWFQVQGKKPWEIPFFDVMEAWDFGGRNDMTSLAMMAFAFGVQVPTTPYTQADKLYHQGTTAIKDLVEGSEQELLATMALFEDMNSEKYG